MKYDLGTISRSRKVLMGVAALWIMLYHSRLFFDAADGTGIFHYLYVFLYNLYQLRSAGQVGVDIFLFLSAIGLYFSLEKDPDVSSFYKRRAIRVLPEYLLINILWSMYLGEGPVELSRNLCGLSFVLDGNLDNWFFILLFFLYLSFPLLFTYKKKNGNRFVFIVFLFSVLLNAALSELAPTVFETVEIALRRIPVFLLGLFIAGDVYIGTKIKHIYIVPIALILFVLSLGYLINTDHLNEMFYHYVCGINGISVVLLLSMIDPVIIRRHLVRRGFEICGDHSMEFYLLYEKIVDIMAMFDFGQIGLMFLCMAICVVLSLLLKRVNERIGKCF